MEWVWHSGLPDGKVSHRRKRIKRLEEIGCCQEFQLKIFGKERSNLS
jgi:hypothetical protein